MTSLEEKYSFLGDRELCSFTEALKIAKRSIFMSPYKIVLQRKDVGPSTALKAARKIGKPFAFHYVFEREDVKKYMSIISLRKAVRMAKRGRVSEIYHTILNRADVSIEQALKIAADSEFPVHCCEVIFYREDVQEYLNS